ncbi:MAG TPA: carboxylating nicotinate-nucleotide diphosphorylase [Gammaproteobacteria bacterium]|jgi:nicotinate-nucleotide pyrophosphorylase (carboxylating)|nr:carboxylating nicotinate-nucleotide diphosphorylase [Gammaproteobacteria bacterium]
MLIEVLDEALLHGVRAALAEDIGSGDITAALIPAEQQAQAHVICRETAVLCGMAWFNAVFAEIDTAVEVSWQKKDGDALAAGDTLCTLRGPARAILSGERTALNFLQTLSATASLSRRYAKCVADLPVKILDTRKTIPGLRAAQKYAVRTGGCHNHRSGLYDAILIKENHIAAAGSIAQAVAQAAKNNPGKMIEVEVEDEAGISAALDAAATRLLLDNFSTGELRAAVESINGRIELEASGNFNLDNLREAAETGVDYISVGSLTKHIHAIDLSMRFDD